VVLSSEEREVPHDPLPFKLPAPALKPAQRRMSRLQG
jgi:hypothetical protein